LELRRLRQIVRLSDHLLNLKGSEADNGGEILEMRRGSAYTMRSSPFSLVITGVYRRVFEPPPFKTDSLPVRPATAKTTGSAAKATGSAAKATGSAARMIIVY
jgi:hypothetical protein